MKKFHCNRLFKISGILIFLLLNIGFIKAQDTLKIDKTLYYRLTIGAGIGSGYPLQEDDCGIEGNVEFALQKQKTVYELGVRRLQEFEVLYTSNVPNSVNSIDLTYGRIYKKKYFFTSISAGIGMVYRCTKGKLLSRTSEGWFSSNSKYEKIISYSIGVPLSAKIFWVPSKFYGLGIELFANINTKNTFYGITLCHQFGKLRP